MEEKRCINCGEQRRCRDSYTSWIFFIIGLIATVAVRVVTVLMSVNPFYGKLAWYIGVGGFLMFFIYKFKIAQARSSLINRKKLAIKVRNNQGLTEEDYNIIGSILCSLSSKKEKINFLFIFVISAIALAWAVYIDFF